METLQELVGQTSIGNRSTGPRGIIKDSLTKTRRFCQTDVDGDLGFENLILVVSTDHGDDFPGNFGAVIDLRRNPGTVTNF